MQLTANQFVWTAQDEIERLLVTQQLTSAGRQRQLARQAILSVLREFPNRHRWSYYNRRFTLRTVAVDSDATCTYDHTGGSSERLLTLASATLPTDGTGAYYRVVIDSMHYDIERVLTSATAILEVNNNPGEDVAAGTACTVYRPFYPMPSGFRKLNHVWDVEQEEDLPIVLEDEEQALRIGVFDSAGTPEFVCLTNRGETLSQMGILFSPFPESARTYDILYEAAPQAIQTWLYDSGKATTDGTTTVTLSDGAATSSRWVGAILRLSSNVGVAPTPMVGSMTGADNPFAEERIIVSVPSGTTLTVDRAISTLTAVKYTISDPLDLDNQAMLLAFQRATDAEYATLMGDKDWQRRRSDAAYSLRLAMENDNRASYRPHQPVDPFRRPTITTD